MSESSRIIRFGEGRGRQVPASVALQHVVDDESLLDLVEELAEAMVARDAAGIHHLLADPRCSRLPRDVREEAMVFSALPERSTRAPMRTLVHLHRMRELERGGETVAAEQIDLFPPGAARDRGGVRLSRDE